MPAKDSAPPRRGRPPIEAAESHARILDAVYELLQERSVRDLTMEAVANRAGVGKPTLYKWWPTKAALVLAMFRERIAVALPPPSVGTAEEAIRDAARALIGPLNGQLGKVLSELIAEGQSEPAILRELFRLTPSEPLLPRRLRVRVVFADRSVSTGLKRCVQGCTRFYRNTTD